MTTKCKTKQSATDRLRELIDAELTRQNITAEEAAREARLPSSAFRSLIRKGRRPNLDRAEELCLALGLSMWIGTVGTATDDKTGDAASER